jgi:hypothetical protein
LTLWIAFNDKGEGLKGKLTGVINKTAMLAKTAGRGTTYMDVLKQPEKISAIVSKMGNHQAVICSWIKAISLISIKRIGP